LSQGRKGHAGHDILLLSKFVDGELDARMFLAVSRQVAQCGGCRRLTEEFRAAGGLIQSGRSLAVVPPTLDRRVREGLGTRQAGRRDKVRFRGVPGVLATAAAGVLLFISSGYLRPPPPRATPIPSQSAVTHPTSTTGRVPTQSEHRTTPGDRSKHGLIKEIKETLPMHNMTSGHDPI
jgi:anti-sigma factor RsiW